jgi:hypothetical protein
MPSVAVRVHHVGVHPSVRGPGVQPSGVQLSGVRTSGSLVPGPSVRPSGVQPVRRPACPGFSRPVSVRPPVASVSSRVSPAAALGGHLGTAGQSSRLERIEFHVVRPRPSGSVDGPGRPGCGHRCGGRVEASGGASAADLAGLCSGGVAAADRPGRPDRRKGAHRQRLRQAGVLAEARRSRTRHVAAILAGARLRSVVVVEPDAGVDGLGRANELDGADGRAAPARPRCAGGAPGLVPAAL